MTEVTIDSVELKSLATFCDERGFFREVIRTTDNPFFKEGFGQLSHSILYTHLTKAWHIHQRQIDWWYVASGVLKVGLHDRRPDSPTYKNTMTFCLGDNQDAYCLKIPPGVAHGCKAIQGPAHIIYVTSEIYDPNDEGRIAHDDPEIGFDWLSGPAIT